MATIKDILDAAAQAAESHNVSVSANQESITTIESDINALNKAKVVVRNDLVAANSSLTTVKGKITGLTRALAALNKQASLFKSATEKKAFGEAKRDLEARIKAGTDVGGKWDAVIKKLNDAHK